MVLAIAQVLFTALLLNLNLGPMLQQLDATPVIDAQPPEPSLDQTNILDILFQWFVKPFTDLFSWPISGPGQAIIIIIIFIGIYWYYREWRLNSDPLPKRIGDYLGTMPHITERFKLRLWELNTNTDPDIIKTIGAIPIGKESYDQFTMDLDKDLTAPDNGHDQPMTQPSASMTAIVPAKRTRYQEEQETITREIQLASGRTIMAPQRMDAQHNLTDIFALIKHPFHLYLGRSLPTEAGSLGNDWVVLCTDHSIDHSDFYTQHRVGMSYMQGYKIDLREMSQAGDKGFVIRETGKRWRGHKVVFIYYPVTAVKKGSTATPEEFQTLNVTMAMMTQLELIIDVLRQSRFNERFARELHRSLRKSQRWLLILSKRNTDANLALSTESYDEAIGRRLKEQLNPWVSAGIMAGITVVTFEVIKRNTTSVTPEGWLMAGIAAGFVGVLVGWLWKRRGNN